MDVFDDRANEGGAQERVDQTWVEPGVSLVLHEERLVAGVERVEAGTVQVRKRIVVEEVTVTVPVRREVVDVVRVNADGREEILEIPESQWAGRVEDCSSGTDARDGAGVTVQGRDEAAPDTVAAPRESLADPTPGQAREGARRTSIVLREERPVITTEAFAYEQLTVDVHETQETVTIVDEVRREVVEVDEGVDVEDERHTGV